MANLIAKAATTIDAPRQEVWKALVTPEAIRKYMFGTTATSDFKQGSPITWKGEWEGRPYEDKGRIRRAVPGRVLEYTHFSPTSGLPDRPENYHTVTIELADDGPGTRVSLSQDNNATEDARAHSEKNWTMMLESLRQYVAAA